MPEAPEDKNTQQSTSAPKPRKAKRRRTGDLSFQTDVAVLRAQGLSQTATARHLDVDQATISRVEKTPAVQEKMASLRDQWKNVAHTRLNEAATAAWDMVAESANGVPIMKDGQPLLDEHGKPYMKRDAKSFDAATRGLAAMEKISASVVGTPQKVEVSGIPGDSNPKENIKNLLYTLFGTPEQQAQAARERVGDTTDQRGV